MVTINTVQVGEQIAKKKDVLATKEDICLLQKEILISRIEMKEQKSELLKWMIVLFTPFYIAMIVFLLKQFL